MAEGAINVEEAKLKRKEWTAKRAEAGYTTATNRIAAAVQKKTGMETRVCIPGHMQRGGSPSAYDRVLATQFGSYAAKLVEIERYGVTVAMVNGHVTENRLEDIAGKTRNVPEGCELLTVARRMGISLGSKSFRHDRNLLPVYPYSKCNKTSWKEVSLHEKNP